MAKVTCAISGIRFNTNWCESLVLPANEGFPHPIFAAPLKYLEHLYAKHALGELDDVDSFLLLLALVHKLDVVKWEHSVTVKHNSAEGKALVENNLAQVMKALEETNAIDHPHFKQPAIRLTSHLADLKKLSSWTKAWQGNIREFYLRKASNLEQDKLNAVSAKLSKLIRSPDLPRSSYTKVVADWAARAGAFPKDLRDSYIEVISSCFSSDKMFNTPLALIKEIKGYCEENIDAGSLNFNTLMQVLNEGICRHVDYLGGSNVSSEDSLLSPNSPDRACLPDVFSSDYTNPENAPLPDTAPSRAANIASNLVATTAEQVGKPPVRTDYPNNISFLKAKLAYRSRAESFKATLETKGAL